MRSGSRWATIADVTAAKPAKPCVVCGRTMTWRRKWARTWPQVRYCSDACRRRGLRDRDRDLEQAVLELLDERPRASSICPSEAARRVDPVEWARLMPATRSAARRLVAAGLVDMTQGGRVVDPSTARGPVRLRRSR